MFPKGRFDDQVDSTSQALAHIGMPSSEEGWMEFIRWDTLRAYGLNPEDIIVTFDYTCPTTDFTSYLGRKVRRERDGFYHCSSREWINISHTQGVTVIEDQTNGP